METRKFLAAALFCLVTLQNGCLGQSETVQRKVHPSLLKAFEKNEANGVNIFVSVSGGNVKALEVVKSLSFHTRRDKLTALKSALVEHASAFQKDIQSYLESKGIPFKSFWISNQIFIKAATKELVESLEKFPEVEDIREEGKVRFGSPSSSAEAENRKMGSARAFAGDEILWNIQKIKADQAWSITNGSGVTVGIIDTGVNSGHEALRDSFRGVEYGWIDVVDGKAVPYDDIGHGSHVAGSISGSHGIGVAPGAEWMACQSCPQPPGHEGEDCLQSSIIACTEFMLCPTLYNGGSPDCSKAPNVVSNSWGYDPGATTFEPIVNAWIVADIVPVFSAGNAMQGRCEVILSPSDIRDAISVCSTTVNDFVADMSSAGPATNHDEIKPEICAPGQEIISASNRADDEYVEMSGTSMATPHISGAIALLLSANTDNNLTVNEVRQLLFNEGVDRELRSRYRSCGGIPDTQFPNYIFGYGRVNALKSVQAAARFAKTAN